MNAREAAYHALLNWQQKGTFLWDSLEYWKKKEKPRKEELDFAYELACQTVRYYGYLEQVAKKIATQLPKKQKERLLLFLGLYQRIFLPNIPLYAVVDTAVAIAKKEGLTNFSRFCNAILRKPLPEDSEVEILFASYPPFLIDCLKRQYGKNELLNLLKMGNRRTLLHATTFENGKIENAPCDEITSNSYIQNCTPVTLVKSLASNMKKAPKRILDLCAAPGGKTLLLSHLYPEAILVANDLPHKIKLIEENRDRFARTFEIHEGAAQEYPQGELFDLILVDTPCSNTGVLYKCPEARWRVSEQSLKQLEELQLSIVKRAVELLAPGGTLWYMTCSVLEQENELFCKKVAELFSLTEVKSLALLPNETGNEGGFACAFIKHS
jgi:16S rRNA (cytosine967-C5)-methyltransferase